jgi:hypothetical protein
MGVSIRYQAFPPQSIFYARLLKERAFQVLLHTLSPHGCGIFLFHKLDPEEIDEILEWVIEEHQDALGPEPQAREWVKDFLNELDRVRETFPGIERRSVLLEKCLDEVEQRLIQHFAKMQSANATEMVNKLLFGDQEVPPPPHPYVAALGLVSLSLVREGARELERTQPESLFPKGDASAEWCLGQFERWRQLYLDAAERGEVILIV